VDIEALHHVSLPVTDVDRARRFYTGVLGLREIERPPFDFPGAWFQAGAGQLHLIARTDATFRTDKPVDSRDIHFGIRVTSFRDALEHLESKGYREDARDEFLRMKVNRHATAGFPQIYILDPDRNVIEINATQLDVD
jgi:catechol 2,3-dioxygenase-like lactoylglutathione lyase family enzyme